MSTTWDAPLAHRPRRSRPRPVRVPPLLIGIGRVLLFLAWAVLMAWAILFRPATLAAQQAPPDSSGPVLRPGDRVRVERTGASVSPFVARVVELRTDTLAVSRAHAGRVAAIDWIPVSEIASLEVSRGRKHNFWRSAGVGLGGGALMGGLLGLSLSNWLDEECPTWDSDCDSEGEHLFVVPWVAAAGAALGLLNGISRGLSSEERWEDVPPARLALGPSGGGGFVVAVVIRVR